MPFVKLALDEEGHVKVEDGKPVYVDENDAEVAVDPPQMYQKIIDLGKENKGHRQKNEELNKKFSIFEDVEDLEAYKAEATKAIESVKNFNDKDWLKADKVETMKRQMTDAHDQEKVQLKSSYENTIVERDSTIAKKNEQIRKLMVSTKFASSKMFSGPDPVTQMTPDAAEAIFGPQIKIEEGDNGDLNLLCLFANGDNVYSRSNPGEYADFNEGIEIIWENYPNKNRYMKSAGAGSGATGGSGGSGDPENEMTKLKKQLETATANGDTVRSIALKNKLFEMQKNPARR